MSNKILFASLAFVLSSIGSAACSEDFATNGLDVPPVVGNAKDSFGFSVIGRTLDYDETYDLDFECDSITVGITVSGYSGGSAQLTVLDASGSVIVDRDLGRNIAEGATSIPGEPAKARLQFVAYSGIVSLGIAKR